MKSTVNVKKGRTQVIPFFTYAFFPMVHSSLSDVPLSTIRCYSLHPTFILYSGSHEACLRYASGSPQVPSFRGAAGDLNAICAPPYALLNMG